MRHDRLIAAMLVAMTASGSARPAWSHQVAAGDLVILHPYAWASETAGQGDAEIYMTIRSKAGAKDKLIAVSSPIAAAARLQRRPTGGAGAAIAVAGVDITPKSETALGPRGTHVQLSGLKAPLVGYAMFPLVLTFAKAGRIEVEVMVEARE